MHALQRGRLPRVHLKDHALRLINPSLVVADRRTRHESSVLQYSRDFDQRDIELAQKSILNELGDMAEVNIHVVHFARVDTLASFGIRLIGKTQMHASRHSERSVELRAGGGTGEDTDLKLLAAEIGFSNAAGQLNRNGLGITRPGEPAHADLVAGPNQRRSFVGAHDLPLQTGVQNTRGGRGGNSHGRRLSDQ
jgi:hypothetical protein